jgi:hypothetical protein
MDASNGTVRPEIAVQITAGLRSAKGNDATEAGPQGRIMQPHAKRNKYSRARSIHDMH